MISVSNHCMERYCRRIKDIQDMNEIRQFIVQNREQITEDLNKMYENSRFIWKGQLYDNTTKNYYIADNIIVVTDTQNSCAVTLYRVDYGFKTDINRHIVKEYLQDIAALYQTKAAKEDEIAEVVSGLENELEIAKNQRKILEQQLLLLKDKEESLSAQIKGARAEVGILNKEIDQIALLICNSLEYKKEVQAKGA